ncbi:CobW family GTP-binding protein [Robinsoniella peoriensis]
MKKEIDLYLISGFLGAGKTTFLQKLLQALPNKKIGVIINEFGNLGIDGMLVEKEGIQLVEINNGSIFCACLKGGFVKTLIGFSKEDIDILLIENSGMADPSNMHLLLQEMEHMVSRSQADSDARPYRYRGAVCITDSVTFLRHVQVLAPVQNQIASSNFIVINKVDLVNQVTIEKIKGKIRELNPKAYLYETMFAQVPLGLLDEKLIDNGYVGETSNQPWNRPATYSLECGTKVSKPDLEQFVKKMQPMALRIKGIADTQEGWIQVDGVGDYLEIKPFKAGKRDVITHTKLVVIGNGPEEFEEKLEDTWKSTCKEACEIYE